MLGVPHDAFHGHHRLPKEQPGCGDGLSRDSVRGSLRLEPPVPRRPKHPSTEETQHVPSAGSETHASFSLLARRDESDVGPGRIVFPGGELLRLSR